MTEFRTHGDPMARRPLADPVADLPLGRWFAAELDADDVRTALREVIDPELGVNIVDLGLVYEVAVSGGRVGIAMTLTTPGCPLGGYLDDAVTSCLRQFPAVTDVDVRLVWEPTWTPELITPAGRAALGWTR